MSQILWSYSNFTPLFEPLLKVFPYMNCPYLLLMESFLPFKVQFNCYSFEKHFLSLLGKTHQFFL